MRKRQNQQDIGHREHNVMWSFLIPQRHTHKCMFNKTKINCPMSAIVHSAIASNIHHYFGSVCTCCWCVLFFLNHHHSLLLFASFVSLPYLRISSFLSFSFSLSHSLKYSFIFQQHQQIYLQEQTLYPLIAIASSNRAISYVDFVTLLSMCCPISNVSFFLRLASLSAFHLIFTFFSCLLVCVCAQCALHIGMARPLANGQLQQQQD